MSENRPFCYIVHLLAGLAAGLAGPGLAAADVSLYQVNKGIRYTQINPLSPSVDTANGYAFGAELYPAAAGLVAYAFVKIPTSNAPTPLTLSPSQNFFEYKKKKNTFTTLNNDYPDGAYGFEALTVHDGAVQKTISLTGSLYPQPPHVRNFAALQSATANGYVQVGWDKFDIGGRADFVRFNVNDAAGNQVFQTPNIDRPNALNGLATNVVLAPGTLSPTQTYSVTVTFQKNVVLDRTNYPGALGVAGYYSETKFDVITGNMAAADVEQVEVAKGSRWLQSDSGPPAPETPHAYEFNASMKTHFPAVVTNCALGLPGETNPPLRSLLLQPDLVTLNYVDRLTTAAVLDARYGEGNYGLSFATAHDGNKSLTLALQSVTNAPPPPQVLDLAALQAVQAGQPFTVGWEAWTNGSSEDLIELRIEDLQGNKVFETAKIGKAGALPGLATNTVVKAGTLAPGGSYNGLLYFKRTASVDTTTYPGVLLIAYYYSLTKFQVQARPADVAAYGVSKGQRFTQSDAGAPVAWPTNGFVFNSSLTGNSATSILSAVTITPTGTRQTMAAQAGGALWSFADQAASQSDLNSTYPDGTYYLVVEGGTDGSNVLAVPLPAGAFPSPPHLGNYPDAQAIDASADFTLAWDPVPGGATNTFIQVLISDLGGGTVFKTPDLDRPAALTGVATSALLPAGSLASNQFYQGVLSIQTVADVTNANYPGAAGSAGRAATTYFSVGTKGPGNPPVLNIAYAGAPPSLLLAATVVPRQSYRLDGSASLPPQWTPLSTNVASSNTLIFPLAGPAGRPHFFYRAVAVP